MASDVYVEVSGPIVNVDRLIQLFRTYFVQELRAIVIPRMRALSRRRTGRLRNSWRVVTTGDRVGVYVHWTFDVQQNKDRMEREGRRLVLVAAQRALRRAFDAVR